MRYANVVGSTCAIVVPIFYAKMVELLKNAWDASKWFPDVLGDSLQQHIQILLQIYDCIRYFLFCIKDGQNEFTIFSKVV